MSSDLHAVAPRIFAELDRLSGVFSVRDLEALFRASRQDWDLPAGTTTSAWLDFLQTEGKLRKHTLQCKCRTVRFHLPMGQAEVSDRSMVLSHSFLDKRTHDHVASTSTRN